MIIDPVTARYAGALYNLAQRKGVLDIVARDIERLTHELATTAMRTIVFNPRVEREAKRQQITPALSGAHELVRNFVNLLVDKRREDVLKGLAIAFRRRALDEKGAVEGLVESARALEPSEIARLETAIGRNLGKQLFLKNRIVPSLVGGARVIAQSRMIDWSVQGRLEALRRKMMDAPLPASRG